MDYRMLYENLVAEAEENGLGGEFVDWGISISKWRADPVAIALYGWLLENEPEGMAAKSERQIDWEMGIGGMASSRRREEAVKSWRRSPGAAERENGGFLVALGLSHAERSAATEALIAAIPEVAFFSALQEGAQSCVGGHESRSKAWFRPRMRRSRLRWNRRPCDGPPSL